MITLERIVNPHFMSVHVTGPHDANHLFILSGIAEFRWSHHSRDDWEGWVHETLHISMLAIPGAPRFYEDQVISHSETVGLASFSFSETIKQDTWGYCIDSCSVFYTQDTSHTADFSDFGIDVNLSLWGFETRLFRITFQLFVLVRV